MSQDFDNQYIGSLSFGWQQQIGVSEIEINGLAFVSEPFELFGCFPASINSDALLRIDTSSQPQELSILLNGVEVEASLDDGDEEKSAAYLYQLGAGIVELSWEQKKQKWEILS